MDNSTAGGTQANEFGNEEGDEFSGSGAEGGRRRTFPQFSSLAEADASAPTSGSRRRVAARREKGKGRRAAPPAAAVEIAVASVTRLEAYRARKAARMGARVRRVARGESDGHAGAHAGSGFFQPGADAVYDQDHAKAVLKYLGADVRYISDSTRWLLRNRDRGVWREVAGSGTEASRALLARVAEKIPLGTAPPAEKKSAGGIGGGGAGGGWAQMTPAQRNWLARKRYRTAASAGAIASFLASTARNGELHLEADELDNDGAVLWRPDGPGWVGEGDRLLDVDVPHRKMTRFNTVFDGEEGESKAPHWDALLEAVWPDPEVREWAMQLFALGVVGIAEKIFIYLYGGPGRGKTSVVELILDTLGSYGVGDLNPSLVGPDCKPWDMVALYGTRLGLIDEAMPPGRRSSETLKRLTGRVRLSGAEKNQKPFTFSPTHVLVFTANHPPELTDEALVARTRLLPCDGDPEAVAAARAALGSVDGEVWLREGPVVLGRLVRAARVYWADPGVVRADRAPLSLQMAGEDLADSQDMLGEWLDSCCELGPVEWPLGGWPTTTVLYDELAAWCGLRARSRHYLGLDKSPDWLGRQLSAHAVYGAGTGVKKRAARGYVWRIRVVRRVLNGQIVDCVG